MLKEKANNASLTTSMSTTRKSDYDNRAELLLQNNWEMGEDFSNRNNKQYARKQVYEKL